MSSDLDSLSRRDSLDSDEFEYSKRKQYKDRLERLPKDYEDRLQKEKLDLELLRLRKKRLEEPLERRLVFLRMEYKDRLERLRKDYEFRLPKEKLDHLELLLEGLLKEQYKKLLEEGERLHDEGMELLDLLRKEERLHDEGMEWIKTLTGPLYFFPKWLWEKWHELLRAYLDVYLVVTPHEVNFSVTTSAKGGFDRKIGSHRIHAPKYLSVHHPLIQMVLFARKSSEDIFSCLKSMAPKSIFDMAKRLCTFASPNLCEAGWIPATRKSESPNAGATSEFNPRESIGRSNELTENESQHHSDPDSRGAELGIIKAVEAKTSAIWIIATAAPHHATGNSALLSGFVTEHDDLFVHAVNWAPMQVRARGAVSTDAVVLPDVWFVPGLTVNLVSVSQLSDLDYSVGFGGGACYIRNAADGTIVGKAHLREGGLYVLDFLKVPLAL